MHRYPAFHNTYYKQAYNYRNYFDYPWHAELHEPSSQFAYETVNSDVPVGDVAPIVEPAEKAPAPRMPPQPPADAAAKRSVPKLAPVVKSNQVSRSAPQALAPVVRASSESQLAPILNAADVTDSEEEPSEETPAVSSKTMRMLRR
jgi:hypothetical protein